MRVPFLNFEVGPVDLLLNFDWGPLSLRPFYTMSQSDQAMKTVLVKNKFTKFFVKTLVLNLSVAKIKS